MDGMEQAKTVEDVRRAARKALTRLSRTFGEWETLICALKADLSDQKSITRKLRKQIKHLPSNEQVEFLNGKATEFLSDAERYKADRKLAEENRDNWKDECSRLTKNLKKKTREFTKLEKAASKAGEFSASETVAETDAIKAELETEKTFSREQSDQISRLRKDLVAQRTERQALDRKLDELQSSLDQRERDRGASQANEKEVQDLRSELERAREQLDKQDKDDSAFRASEEKVNELRDELQQARERLGKQEKDATALQADDGEVKKLRDELEKAREELQELAEMESKLEEADEKVGELQKKIESLEFNNKALKNGTDLLLKEKAESRTAVSKLQESIEELRVKVRMTEARLAKARAGEESTNEDTLSMSAIQSRDIRFQVQNEELRVKLGKQRQDLDKLEEVAQSRAKSYKDLNTSSQAQQDLIAELQAEIDEHNKKRTENRKSDVQVSQFKLKLDEKQKMIESLQAEIDEHNKKRTENRKSDVQVSQFKLKLDEKQKMIESLQAEILNQKSAGPVGSGKLTAGDETQTLKLNKKELKSEDSVASKDQRIQIAELNGQLAKKDLAMKAVQTTLAELRNRFHSLASRDRGDNTVTMNGPKADGSSAQPASADQTEKSSVGDNEVAATIQLRRPKFD